MDDVAQFINFLTNIHMDFMCRYIIVLLKVAIVICVTIMMDVNHVNGLWLL